MTLSPSDFPIMRTPAYRRGYTRRGFHVCPVCHLAVEPRNSRAHAKACARRKRQDPALWLLWKLDMNDTPTGRMRKTLGPIYTQQLVKRGLLAIGPLNRKGEL